MSVYMDDIAAPEEITKINKGIRNCAKVVKKSKMRYRLKKTKFTMVKKKTEREEIADENAVSKTMQKTKAYQDLGVKINEEGNLEEHVKIIARRFEAIIRETDAIGVKNQVGKEC